MKNRKRRGAAFLTQMRDLELPVLVIARAIEDCNDAACRLLGRARDAIVGRSPLEFSAPVQADGLPAGVGGKARIDGALSGQPQWFQWRFLGDAGDEVATLIHLERREVGGRTRLVAHVQDLSRLLNAEASLEESEHRLRQILDQSSAVVFWKDLAGRYRFVNEAFCRVVGRPAHEVIGRCDAEVMAPDVAARLRANDRQVIEGRHAVSFEEQGVFNGELRTYLVNKFPLLDPRGAPYAVCGIATDITDRQRMAEALKTASLAVSNARGATIFQELVRFLGTTLEADWAFIATRDGGAARRMHVLALWADGAISENFDYELAGTPCETVAGQGFRVFPRDLPRLFPGDRVFRRLGMESYAGIPLDDNRGDALGLMAVVSRRPLDDPSFVESVLKIFAVRAVAELERDRMDRELRASEESYRAIFEASEDCIFVHDMDTAALVDVNPKACEVFGYDYDTMLGLNPGDLGSGEAPYTGVEARRWLQQARDGAVVRFEWRRRNADGSLRWDEVCLKRVRLAGVDRILAVTRDITDTKERAEAIARSEDRLRATVEASLDCIIAMDERGRIREFNPAAEACFGFRSEEVVGRNLADMLIPERMREAHRQGIERYLREGHGPFIGRRVEVSARRADGSVFPAELAISVAEGAEGRLFVGYLRDITERKEAEAARAALETRLRQAQKMEAIGHLAGGIAHDFNNILTSITGYLALAGERQAQLADPKLGRYLEQAGVAAGRARDLIRQMLTFSRGQRGAPRPLSLRALVEDLVLFLHPMLPASIDFSVDPGRDTDTVMADPVQIEQVLMNLCLNARDALGGRGGIRISVGHRAAVQTVCAACRAPVRGPFVTLSVVDDGPGIEPAVLERMFEPFFSTKEVGKGSGMGLATVHGIVHEHGGHVLVDTMVGGGSAFTVLLPPLPGQAEIAVPKRAGEPASRAGARLRGRVLLVDDEEMVAAFLHELLEGWGLQVTVCRDGLAARDVFSADSRGFDLVLTDHTMPRMTGLELAREISRARPGMPVLLFTGYAEGMTDEVLRAAGASMLLPKPVDPGVLFACLADYLPERVETG